MDNLATIVGKNLANLRKTKGLTQSELASLIHYSDKSISKWELGYALPSVDILMDFCSFYGVTLDYLVSEKTEEEAIEALMDSMHNLYAYIREMQMLNDNISSCINSAVTTSDDMTGEHKLNDIIKRITQFKSHGMYWSSGTFGSYYGKIINICMYIACLICATHLDNDKIITEE